MHFRCRLCTNGGLWMTLGPKGAAWGGVSPPAKVSLANMAFPALGCTQMWECETEKSTDRPLNSPCPP